MRVNHSDTLLSVQPHGPRFAAKQEQFGMSPSVL